MSTKPYDLEIQEAKLFLKDNTFVEQFQTEVNEALEDDPGLLNKDAFENWIIKVELTDTSELKDLMDAKAYEEFCAE